MSTRTLTLTEPASDQTAIDYDSHPTDLGVTGGYVNKDVGIQKLREIIPAHCFRSSYQKSLYYLFRDLVFAGSVAYLASWFIPHVNHPILRLLAWGFYGWLEGLIFTGLWVLGHECGHGSFSPSQTLNDLVGFVLHSSFLTPYFAWKSTHRRHHIYANHMMKDLHYIPPIRQSYMDSIKDKVSELDELTEDAPLVLLLRIFLQQVCGWPFYLLMNITAAPSSLPKKPSKSLFGNSHFAPHGSLFLPQEAGLIILSDIGVLSTLFILWAAGLELGSFTSVMLLYGQPFFWLNNWIIAITYCHHTHPDVPKFEPEAWSFVKGATATVDRDFGFVGRFLLHGIVEFHVIHHLFSRIPFYHAEEATNAIIPILGKDYHSDKQRGFLAGLWDAFKRCQWVEPDKNAKPGSRALWFRAGPCPPPEYSMGQKVWRKKQQ